MLVSGSFNMESNKIIVRELKWSKIRIAFLSIFLAMIIISLIFVKSPNVMNTIIFILLAFFIAALLALHIYGYNKLIKRNKENYYKDLDLKKYNNIRKENIKVGIISTTYLISILIIIPLLIYKLYIYAFIPVVILIIFTVIYSEHIRAIFNKYMYRK